MTKYLNIAIIIKLSYFLSYKTLIWSNNYKETKYKITIYLAASLINSTKSSTFTLKKFNIFFIFYFIFFNANDTLIPLQSILLVLLGVPRQKSSKEEIQISLISSNTG